jgi:hypothetical protein
MPSLRIGLHRLFIMEAISGGLGGIIEPSDVVRGVPTNPVLRHQNGDTSGSTASNISTLHKLGHIVARHFRVVFHIHYEESTGMRLGG